ncbi:MAG: hypothetical protein LKF42_09695 [Streptococcaceae bacterium]|jgi:hypothetical protein|nr:hypothetical protein [Streptococcaceae bacterium]
MNEIRSSNIDTFLKPYFSKISVVAEKEFKVFFDEYKYDAKILNVIKKYNLINNYKNSMNSKDDLKINSKNDMLNCIQEIYDKIINNREIRFLVCNKKVEIMRNEKIKNNSIRILKDNNEVIDEDILKYVDLVISSLLDKAIETSLKETILSKNLSII